MPGGTTQAIASRVKVTSTDLVAAAAAVGLAALLGVSDAPNSTAALVSARSGSYPAVAAWSIGWHLVGGLVAGTAVARTVVGLVHVGPHLLEPALASGCIASVGFTWLTTRRGFPTSASVGLVGGLAGAGVMAGGWHAVAWGQLSGFRLLGIAGVLVGILAAPVLGALAAGALDRGLRPLSFRLRRRSLRGLHGGLWFASAAVAVTDGSNDGQKAMALLAVALSGPGTFAAGGGGISWAERIACASVLAIFTVLGGRRIVLTVSRGLGKESSVDDLAAQSASAVVIFLGGLAGLPLSTSTVVTSSMIGTGLARRQRHIRWQGVARIVAVWGVTVPSCAVVGGVIFELWKAAS